MVAPEAQIERKEAQQLTDAIGVKIEKPSPIFETYKDALDWISEQSKGSTHLKKHLKLLICISQYMNK